MGPRGTAVSPWAAGESALAPGAPPASPSLLALVFAGLLVSYILILVFHLLSYSFLFPTPKSGIPVTLSLVRSALASHGFVLELAGIGSNGHGKSFQQPLKETTPVVPCYQSLATRTQHTKK